MKRLDLNSIEDLDNLCTDDKRISLENLIQTCKYRHGAQTCRYIVFFEHKKDFYCVKNISKFRRQLDISPDQWRARGDNCDGL